MIILKCTKPSWLGKRGRYQRHRGSTWTGMSDIGVKSTKVIVISGSGRW